MDLWSIAEGDPDLGGGSNGNVEALQLENGSTVLLVGDSGCGKSSLLQAFLKPNSSKDPKPTFALEYSFARRKNAGSQGSSSSSGGNNSSSGGRTVAHLWELGGDIYEPKLLEIPLSQKNIALSSVIVICDLSKPKNVFSSLKRWVSLARDVIQRRLKALAESGPEGAAATATLKDTALQAYGSEHPDQARVRPCEIPLVILGNKYDSFKSVASADRRLLLQVMRFVAHYHGATLLFTSSFEREAYRALFNSVCFGLTIRPALEVGLDKPLCITAGRDDFSSILLGTVGGEVEGKSRLAYSEADVAGYVSAHGVTRESWGRFADLLAQAFGAPDAEPTVANAKDDASGGGAVAAAAASAAAAAAAGTETAYPEPEVDDARAQSDLALERYLEESARREALGARSALPSSSVGGVGGRGDVDESKDSGVRDRDAAEAKSSRRNKK